MDQKSQTDSSKSEPVTFRDALEHDLRNILNSLDVARSGASPGKPITLNQSELLRMVSDKLRTTIEKVRTEIRKEIK